MGPSPGLKGLNSGWQVLLSPPSSTSIVLAANARLFRFGLAPIRLLNVIRLSRQPLVSPIGLLLRETVAIIPGTPGTGQLGTTARSAASVIRFLLGVL